jgi:hypothetical protein
VLRRSRRPEEPEHGAGKFRSAARVRAGATHLEEQEVRDPVDQRSSRRSAVTVIEGDAAEYVDAREEQRLRDGAHEGVPAEPLVVVQRNRKRKR